MDAFEIDGKFASISHRVVSTYRRMMTDFCPVVPDDLLVEQQETVLASQRDLHNFFTGLYHLMYTSPERFGLPLNPDTCALSDHGKEGPNKTDIKRILDRPRKQIENGLSFIRALALNGRLEGEALVIQPDDSAFEFLEKKPGKAWREGMAVVGLDLVETAGMVRLTSEKFSRMMPALQALALACTGAKDPHVGRVFFARCDFQALKGNFKPDPVALFHIFSPAESAWALEQHTFFTSLGYQPQVNLVQMFQWQVKYQGKRAIKGTPLFEIYFDERQLHQMRAGIKCAAAFRIAPLLEKHSVALQQDFNKRAFNCLHCNWCDSRPHLGPVDVTLLGETRKICWFVPGDLTEFTPETTALVHEYAELHEELG